MSALSREINEAASEINQNVAQVAYQLGKARTLLSDVYDISCNNKHYDNIKTNLELIISELEEYYDYALSIRSNLLTYASLVGDEDES